MIHQKLNSIEHSSPLTSSLLILTHFIWRLKLKKSSHLIQVFIPNGWINNVCVLQQLCLFSCCQKYIFLLDAGCQKHLLFSLRATLCSFYRHKSKKSASLCQLLFIYKDNFFLFFFPHFQAKHTTKVLCPSLD